MLFFGCVLIDIKNNLNVSLILSYCYFPALIDDRTTMEVQPKPLPRLPSLKWLMSSPACNWDNNMFLLIFIWSDTDEIGTIYEEYFNSLKDLVRFPVLWDDRVFVCLRDFLKARICASLDDSGCDDERHVFLQVLRSVISPC